MLLLLLYNFNLLFGLHNEQHDKYAENWKTTETVSNNTERCFSHQCYLPFFLCSAVALVASSLQNQKPCLVEETDKGFQSEFSLNLLVPQPDTKSSY